MEIKILIIICFCNSAQLKCLYKMAASLKSKRTPITTPPYQVLSVDITLDPPIFSLVTTFKLPLTPVKDLRIWLQGGEGLLNGYAFMAFSLYTKLQILSGLKIHASQC